MDGVVFVGCDGLAFAVYHFHFFPWHSRHFIWHFSTGIMRLSIELNIHLRWLACFGHWRWSLLEESALILISFGIAWYT